jgi:2-amino-4-hydroxy-6-hydroxymethyldihydropteridine diphosphokinase
MAIVPAGIALGSNLGDRAAELDAGIAFLRLLSVDDKVRESSRLETRPVDCPAGSPLFLNAVAEIRVDTGRFSPRRLMEKLQAFERERGRPAERETNAPRPLDLDILYFGDVRISEPDLVIPHPRALQRRFVLQPLAHLRPDLILPGQKKSMAELLEDSE